MTCECCRSSSGTRLRSVLWLGQLWQARICDDCANGGHMYQRCFLCKATKEPTEEKGVWDCAQTAHVYAEHRVWLHQLEADPDPTGAIAAGKASRQRHIGRVPLRMEGE